MSSDLRIAEKMKSLSPTEKYLLKAFEEVSGLCRMGRHGDFIPGWIDQDVFKKYFQVEFSAVSGSQYTCPETRIDLAKQAAAFLERQGVKLDLSTPLVAQG